jgi:hypothetical protein
MVVARHEFCLKTELGISFLASKTLVKASRSANEIVFLNDLHEAQQRAFQPEVALV